MVSLRALITAVGLVALSACAGPSVDTTVANFDDSQYADDLDLCRGGTAVEATLYGLGGAFVGSAFGAVEGAYHGAITGAAPEGAVIGALVGSAVGFAVGIYEPIEKREQSVRRCLSQKGYLPTSS